MVEIPGIGKDLEWWLGLTGVAAVSLVAAIAAGWQNAALMAAGFAGIGVGQWMDHPLLTKLHPRFKITSYPFHPSVPGVALTVIGAGAALYGAVRAIWFP